MLEISPQPEKRTYRTLRGVRLCTKLVVSKKFDRGGFIGILSRLNRRGEWLIECRATMLGSFHHCSTCFSFCCLGEPSAARCHRPLEGRTVYCGRSRCAARRLAEKAKHFGRKVLNDVASIVTGPKAHYDERIAELAGDNGQLEAVVFKSGRRLPRRALFFDTPCVSQSQIGRKLGCRITKKGGIRCGRYEATSVPGVFVAGYHQGRPTGHRCGRGRHALRSA